MGEAKHDGLAVPGRVILAHEPPFRIGDLAVDPPTRQIERGELRESLEPRVMQVLVVLFRARGRIVPRDDLMTQCWDGRVVGDDAINRVISRIRQVAAGIGGDAFGVETIAKVGYRLVTATTDAKRRAPSVRRDRRRLVLGSAAAAIVAATGSGFAWRAVTRRPAQPDEAKLLFNRAEALRSTGFTQDNRQAIAYLREAVRVSPGYGEAWGALALAYSIALASESPERVEGLEELRREAIRQAGLLDPGNADSAAAQLPGSHYGRWAEVEQVYRASIARHPHHATAYQRLGMLLMDVGRWRDAVDVLGAAKARNSFSPLLPYNLTVSLWSAGRITDADAEIDQALKRWPQHSAIWQTKVKLLAFTGRPRMALALASDPGARPVDEQGDAFETRRLFLTALATGQREDAARAVSAMSIAVRSGREKAATFGLYCAALGYTDLALDMVEGFFLGTGDWSLPRPTGALASFATHPLFQPHARSLWTSSRFTKLVDRIGLERYWRASGITPEFRRTR